MARRNKGLAVVLPPDEIGDLRRDAASGVVISLGGRDRGPVIVGGGKPRKVHRQVRREDIEVEGRRATVTRIVDTLGQMRANGTISEEMFVAGLRFQAAFDLCGWEAMPAMRFDGMPPSGKNAGGLALSVMAARDDVWRVMNVLGWQQPCGVAVWWVVGMRWSLRQLAEHETVSRIEVWTGSLRGALGILSLHYAGADFDRRVKRT